MSIDEPIDEEESLTEALQRVIVRSILARHHAKTATDSAEGAAIAIDDPDPGAKSPPTADAVRNPRDHV